MSNVKIKHPKSRFVDLDHSEPIVVRSIEREFVCDEDNPDIVLHIRRRVQSIINGPVLTVQADKDRACIHKILARAAATGFAPQRVAQPLDSENIPNVNSFHEAMNVVAKADAAFQQLPLKIREKFDYNPANLLAFCSDEKNLAEMRSLGLAKAVESLAPVGVVAPTTQAEPTGAAPEGGR